LARTFLKPEIILYDEPTTGLDTITSREISELVLEKKKNKLFHHTHDWYLCKKHTADRLVILKEGIIHVEGTHEELESDDEWVRSFFI
jgi:phospholipid/cholesterol/gamma-HCH transport system ATP-binding protein